MLSCEQCLFTYVIDKNIVAPDPRIGSQPALTGQWHLDCTHLLSSADQSHSYLRGYQRLDCNITAFIAACLANPLNTTIKPLALALPPSWMGPQSNKLGLGATVVAVAAGAILGGGSLYTLTHLE
jgi:hypothetical protein